MRELENIKHFDEYVDVLNEELLYGNQKKCESAFIRSTPVITFEDGTSVKAIDIVNAVREATHQLSVEVGRTFKFAENTLNIIYLAHSNKYKTMAVDSHMNLYMNASFIYHTLKMDPELIGAVIMHEALHALYKHIERGLNWLAAEGKTRTPQTWHDTNLAADVEVNRTLVRINVIKEERLINEIHGLYLKKIGNDTGVVPMEIILNNEEYMAKLREMCPPPVDPSKQPPQSDSEVQTSDEWNRGYKDAWNKVAELIKKYGHKGVWEKLVDSGIVNPVGEIYTDHEIEDIMGLEYLVVKTFEEYINEDLNVGKDEMGKTYKDGFMNAFGKLVNKLYNTVNPSDEPGGGKGPEGGPQLKSDLPEDELEPIEFPEQDNDDEDDEKEGGDPGVPEPIVTPGKNTKKQKSPKGGKGDKGKKDEELTDDDKNKLIDDINQKTNGGQSTITTEQDVEFGGIGGTGSFQEDGLSDDDLREAGYEEDDIKKINEVREDNKIKNSKAGIEKQIEKMKRDLPDGDFVKRTLKSIEIEANKYKNIWKEILKEFMAKRTRRAGNDKPNGSNDWKNKKTIARGEYGINHQRTAQDPQDVNVYVDVSGSVDTDLLEIIGKSLVIFTQQWKYSGINICPWADKVGAGGIYKIKDFYRKPEPQITAEILEAISEGIAKCGGGTSAQAAIAAMIDAMEETLNDPKKKKKDDIHVVITDGQFDYENIESRITNAVKSIIGRDDVAEKAPKNTIWMIYSSYGFDEDFKEKWNNEIKKGKIIFINSKVVKNNG